MPELADICRRLETQSVTGVARDLGQPRSTVVGAVQRIRDHFERHALDRLHLPAGLVEERLGEIQDLDLEVPKEIKARFGLKDEPKK